jgi:hypothetical protein
MVSDLPDYAVVNRQYWDDMAEQWVGAGEHAFWLTAI